MAREYRFLLSLEWHDPESSAEEIGEMIAESVCGMAGAADMVSCVPVERSMSDLLEQP